jgi:hypothetical protein
LAAVARKVLVPRDLVIVVVGKADDIAPQLDIAGYKVERVSWTEPVSKRDRVAAAASKNLPVTPARTAAGKKLLDQALAAAGGAGKLRALKSVVETGAVKMATQGTTLEGTWRRQLAIPDRMRLDMTIPKLNIIVNLAVSPDAVWQGLGDRMVEAHGDEAALARADLWREHATILLRHLERGVVVQGLGKQTVDGKEYDAVMIRKPDGAGETLIFLDPASHLLALLVYAKNGDRGIERYSDYRAVDGIQLPFHQQTSFGAQAFDVTMTEIKVNAPVNPHAFDLPKQ